MGKLVPYSDQLRAIPGSFVPLNAYVILCGMAYSLEAPVLENVRYPNHNYFISLRAPKVAQKVLPGQFVMAAELEGLSLPYPLLKRALAVYSTDVEQGERTIIGLLLKVVGDGTRRLASLQPGDTMSLIGPLGNSFDVSRAAGKTALLVAGGIGIASFYLLAEMLHKNQQEVHLIYGGRSGDDLVRLDDFHRLGVPILTTTDDGSHGLKGLVTEGLKHYLAKLHRDDVSIYTCGPSPMMQAVTALAERHNIPCQISVEAKMACGFGVCLGCSVKTVHSYQLACRKGPVFDSSEFVWEETEP